MKSIKRILATALMLVMVFTLLGGTLSVSAASDVTCTDSIIVVDDDFANAAKGTAVSATVAGTKYKGVIGSTAFATIQDAYAALANNGAIYVAAGIYAGPLQIDKNISLYGNKANVNPNNPNQLSQASGKRSATGVEESILQDMQISYLPKGMEELISGSYSLTMNGFAVAGDSCVRLQGERVANSRTIITNNVFDLVNEKAYSNLGVSDDAFSAVTIGTPAEYSYVAAQLEFADNRIERVSSAGNGLATTSGISSAWVTDLKIDGNYIANVTGDGFNVAHLVTSTVVSNNYVKNAGKARVHSFIRGTVMITGNTFDTVGGTTANGQYALGVYGDATTAVYSSNWPVDTETVVISGNTFTNVGKAIRLYGRLRQSDTPINSSPFGAQIFDNIFVPAAEADCTFIHMSYCDGAYKVPVYNNYTGSRNPKDICLIDASDPSAAFNFGEYWLNADKTDASNLLDVSAITNQSGVSFAAADIATAPYCTIAVSVPAPLSEIQIGLNVKEGAFYELFADENCTVPLANDTVALTNGQISYAYAKVHYGDYSIVYTILLSSKVAYTDYLDASEYVVGPEIGQYPTAHTIYVQVGDSWRRAVVGHSAFADLPMAMEKAMSGDTIYMTAGRYESQFTIQGKGVKILGAKAGINPNNMNDYSRSDERANLNEETLFTAEMTLMSGINGISFDGVTFTEMARFLFSGTFGIENMTFENIMCTGSTNQDALLYRGRNDTGKNTFSNFRLAHSRFEGAGTNYVMRLPNISNGIFEANVFSGCNKNIYMGGHDGSSADVLMFKDNIFTGITVNNFLYIGQSTNGTNDIGARVKNSIAFDGNKVIDCTGTVFMYLDRWTAGNHLTVTNNRFEGSSKGYFSVNCYDGFTGQTIDIHENFFGSGMNTVVVNNLKATVADCSYNYFANGPTKAISGEGKYVPYYIDEKMTKLAGAYEVVSVIAPAGAVLDTDNRTITYNATSPVDVLDFNVEVSENTTYALYEEITCETEIPGNQVTLNGMHTQFYVKVIAEDGVSYNVYTVTVDQPANNKAELLGIDVEGSTWVDQGTKYNCILPNHYVSGPIRPLTSAGATVSVYAGNDTELTTPINYNADLNIPVGKTTYFIKVTSEDGTVEAVYEVNLTRSKSTLAELRDIKDSIKDVTIDGLVATMTVGNETESLLPELVVNAGATYELFKDIGCNIYLDEAIDLKVGDNNKVYAKVIAEDGVSYQVYTIVIDRLDKSAEKRIMVDSFPKFATSEDELANDATGEMIGLKRIDNNAKVIYLQPNGYIDSIDDELVVNDGASYEIFAAYDEITGTVSKKVSSDSEKKTIQLEEGTNVFYIRINAMNGSVAIYRMEVLNEIKNTESEILSVNGFNLKRDGNVITGSNSTDNPQIDIFVSENATVKVYADRKKTKEIASTMTSYTVTETKETFTDCKLSNPMPQSYMVMYVDVTSQTGVTTNYVLKLTSGMFSVSFTDVPGHWAANYITQAYQMGVTSGTQQADGSYTFNPQDKATREQVAVFMTNLLGVNTASYANVKLNYKDNANISKWAANSVKTVYAMGIMQGDGANFNPKANISRQEFMSVMVRAAALDTSKGSASQLKRFKDAGQVAKWAKTAVATAVAYGLVNGDENGYLNPNNSISRAEIVTIMVGAKDYVR